MNLMQMTKSSMLGLASELNIDIPVSLEAGPRKKKLADFLTPLIQAIGNERRGGQPSASVESGLESGEGQGVPIQVVDETDSGEVQGVPIQVVNETESGEVQGVPIQVVSETESVDLVVEHFHLPSGSTVNGEVSGDEVGNASEVGSNDSFGTREDLEFTIKLFSTGGEIKNLKVWQHSTVGEVLALVLWEQKPFDVFYNDRKLHKTQRLSKFVPNGGLLHVVPKDMSGGAGNVINKFLKKSDALVNLQKKSKEQVIKKLKLDTETLGREIPETLKPFLDVIEGRLLEFQMMAKNESNSIKTGLDILSDEKLIHLEDIMQNKAGTLTEDKLVAVADCIFDDIGLIESSIPFLNKLKQKLITGFVEVYGVEYSFEKGGALKYNNEAFLKDIVSVKNYRRGIKRLSDASSSQESKVASCIIS